ncbi:DUF2254 domain-containing protein [Fretibacter rubidus]|uniref:DUF2254 domain-containing protein n=1 Tax=Fretibacter rubidus TaxID=570162 RepID=UPI003529D86B
MNARLIKAWEDLKSSYYFIPGLMAFGACILAYVTSTLDERMEITIAQELGLFQTNSADSARVILSTIAGSMMSVAAVTFSITMVAVTSAAGQYGPRLIGNFMRDRGNQVTLGTFTSTFIYCLLILRVARAGGGDGSDIVDFVPNISLLTAMGLTLFSVAVMIYFIHHIPETLNVGNITGQVGRRLRRDLEDLYPSDLGEAKKDDPDLSTFTDDTACSVGAKAEGYIQAVNDSAIMALAKDNNCVVFIDYRPGDFVTQGDVLLRVWRDEDIDDDLANKFRAGFAMGQERTAHQNVLFLADELVEILARALSPGVNDPFTAINCINWFHSAIKAVMRGTPPSPYRFDKDGQFRVMARPISFERFVSVICDQSRIYIAGDRNATIKMLTVLTELTAETDAPSYRAVLQAQLGKLRETSLHIAQDASTRLDLNTRFDMASRMISDRDYFLKERYSDRWVGGRA